MSAVGEEAPVHQQALDWLFARLGGQGPVPPSGLPIARESVEAAPRPDVPLEADVPAPPEVRSAEDLKLGARWLQRERQRLEAYTRAQLARIQQEHQALVGQNYLNEQTLILRSQELTRREEVLLAQGRAIQQQADELARREQALAGQLREWWQVSEQAASPEQAGGAGPGAARDQSLAQAMQAETAALQQSREQARQELESLLGATEDLRQTRAKEEAALKARQEQLEQRLLATEKASLAVEQRQAELEDLEARLRREVEEQERDLLRQRQSLEGQSSRLRAEQAALRAKEALLEHRLQSTADSERGVEQRQAELDQLQARLDQLAEELERRLRDLDKLPDAAVIESASLEVREEPAFALAPALCKGEVKETKLSPRTSGSHPGTSRFDRWMTG